MLDLEVTPMNPYIYPDLLSFVIVCHTSDSMSPDMEHILPSPINHVTDLITS